MPGTFGENFPYSNFHDLNMDWIIQIVKEFKDNQSTIEQSITDTTDEAIERANTEITNIVNRLIETIPADYTTLENSALQSSGILVTDANVDTYKELNNLQVQRIYFYGRAAYLSGELLHYPTKFTQGSLVITLNYQNPAIAGEVQLAFSPIGEGYAYRANNGVQWTEWAYSVDSQIENSALQSSGIFVTDTNVNDYKELNNLQVQRIYFYGRAAYLSGELLHYPTKFTQGSLVITLNYQTSAIAGEVQLAFSPIGEGYAYRANNGVQWTEWVYSVDSQIENRALQSSEVIVTDTNVNDYKELNNLQVQRIYLYGRAAYLSGELLHYPTKFTQGSLVITLNYQTPAIAGEVQLAFSMNGDGYAYRANNGVQWTEWLYSINETAVQPSGTIYFDTNVSGHTDIALEPQCKIITYTRSAVLTGLQHAPTRFKQGFTFVKMPYLFGNNTGEMFIAVDLASGAIASKTITTSTDTPYVYSNPYYTVGATGCDFTTIRACMEYIARFKIENATVFITDGIYDLVTEYADVLENTVVNGTGLPIGGNTHIIMGEHSEIRFLYEGNRADIGENFSVFNIYGSCTFEHIKINCKNCRYAVHDDVPVMISKGVITEDPKDLIVKYIDCTFRHLGNPNVSYSTPICIGGGTIAGAMYIIDGGSYGTANTAFPYPISYHNHYRAQHGNFGARVVIRNTWLPTGQAIRFGTYGDSPIVGTIDGCKLGAATNYGTPHSYFIVEEWNNTIS